MTGETAELLDLDQALSQSYDSITADPEPTPEEEAPKADPVAEETPTEEEIKAEVPKAEDSEKEAAKGEAEEEITDPENEAEEETSQQAIQAPVSWSAAEKDEFSKLPPEAQEIVARREGEREHLLMVKSQELSESQQSYAELDAVFEPRQQLLQEQNLTKGQAVSELVGLWEFSKQNPVGYIKHFAQHNGLDLANLNEQGEPEVNPVISGLIDKVSNLEGQLNKNNTQQYEAAANEARQEVESFAAGPENKYFDQVVGDMMPLMQSGSCKTLKEAYDKAVWANEGVRNQLLQEREATKETKRIANARKAKKAAGTQLGSKGADGEKTKPKDFDAALSENYDAIVESA